MRYNLLDEYHLTWKGRDAANSYEVKYSLNVCGTLTVVTLFSQSKAIQFHKSLPNLLATIFSKLLSNC